MVVERAYGYSRGLIENWITSYLVPGGESDEKSEEITNQLLKIYDELYLQLWVNRNQTSNQVRESSGLGSIEVGNLLLILIFSSNLLDTIITLKL